MGTFREYKSKKSGWRPRRRIPIGRGLLVLLLGYAVYASGAVQKVYRCVEAGKSSLSDEPDPFSMPWPESCEGFHGNAFALGKGTLVQCSWALKGENDIAGLPENAALRYAAGGLKMPYPLRVHWIADSLEFAKPRVLGVQTDSSVVWIFRLMLADSSLVWVRSDGCRFPGTCPRNPLQGGALPIAADFDFAGRENLLLKDLFMGIGEAPVYPVLPGRVVSVSRDSAGFDVLLYHGGNLFTRSSGLSMLSPGIGRGASVLENEPLGRLAPSDSAVFFLEVLRNGRFVRWDDFFRSSHVATAFDVERFRAELGL